MEDSKFERVLSKKDIFAIAFGAMIGWGWVVMAGDWIKGAGTLGSIMAFIIGGIMVLFVGLTYAELTAAMPQCGGEHVFSLRALGKNGSFVCTWGIVLGYVGVVAFEACAFPTVIQYICPGFLKGYMYTIAGFDIYASWVAVGVVASIIITIINYFGAKSAAKLQTILTISIAAIGVALVAASGFSGNIENTKPLFTDGVGGILTVAVMTPFMFVGFDVIPQAAEEINVPFKKIGKIMILSIVMAVIWYIMIIIAVSMVMTKSQLDTSTLVTADAMKNAFFGSEMAAKVVIIGGMAGIVTSWNSFFMGGSRAIYSLAESKMLPGFLAKLHPKYKTPTNAILLIGVISVVAPFFGRAMMVWLTDAGSFGVVVAYVLVSMSFLVLRFREPDMIRPYKVKCGKIIGGIAVLLSGFMMLLYLPGMPSGLVKEELIMVGAWTVLGIIFYSIAKLKYSDFGVHEIINIEGHEEEESRGVKAFSQI
ncbi:MULTISPECIES: APC family permease [Clostridium]|uniref:APC family permease n=1 Tax=Clostridium TaxID=1485 RepID=UPI00051B7650|nr:MULTISPECIES: APC family permease [Clostridium]AXB84451.1 amino acid permease [Clostridium butyricum]KIU07370.1 amino acid permease-associated region [Clostridium butyricum]MBA8967207.1 amino acid transporter [Clostridium butyricum]MBA8971727.1 amino acid transporter [Clostridium butyricum]MBC2427408.1 amino acid permease [Clostridium butyricum]